MNRMLMFTILLACADLSAIAARAEPYWVSYDGTDFPENQGWTRHYGAGGAQRWIENGALVLDGRAGSGIYDSYSMLRSVDPGLNEMFIMRWRLLVDEIAIGHYDPAVGVFSDDSWSVAFTFSESRIVNLDDLGMSASYKPGVFHVFELRSWDMRAFELRIDDTIALTGDFVHVITASKVAWGDGAQGAASLSHWDSFAYGIVPEPGVGFGLGVIVALRLLRNRHAK